MKRYWKYGISTGICLATLTVRAFSIGMWERDWPRDDMQIHFSLEEVRRDYRQATDQLVRRHPMPYVEEDAFKAFVAVQSRHLHDGMTEIEFFRVLAPVVEALGCGHSNLQTSEAYERVMMSRDILFPLDVAVVGSQLFVSDADHSAIVPRGSCIMSINGRSADDILESMLSVVTSDGLNRTGKIAKINHQFAHYYHLAADQSSTFDIDYRDAANGRTRRLTLPGESGSELYGADRNHSTIDLYLDYAGM